MLEQKVNSETEDITDQIETAANGLFEKEQEILSIPPNEPEGVQYAKTRGNIAFPIIVTFCMSAILAILGALFGSLVPGFQSSTLIEVLRIVFPLEIAVVSGVTGFYFGAQQK